MLCMPLGSLKTVSKLPGKQSIHPLMTLTWNQELDWNRQCQNIEAMDNTENMDRRVRGEISHEAGRKITGLVISTC